METCLYYFLQLHINLQLSQNKEFKLKEKKSSKLTTADHENKNKKSFDLRKKSLMIS